MAVINSVGVRNPTAEISVPTAPQACLAEGGQVACDPQSYPIMMAYLNGMLAGINMARNPSLDFNPCMLSMNPMMAGFGGVNPMMMMLMMYQQQQQMMMMLMCLLAGRQQQSGQQGFNPLAYLGNPSAGGGVPTYQGTPTLGGGGAAARALQAAQGEVGVTGACNSGEVRRFSQGRSEAWCADFVSWAYEQSGRSPFGHRPSVPDMNDWAHKQGLYHRRGDGFVPHPGDIIFFGSEGGDHVGLVKSVDPDGTIHTVEGNTGRDAGRSAQCGAVNERRYPPGSVRVHGFADMSRYA